jgi:hypothetical protein
MGCVAMGTGGSYKFQGAHITQIAYCLYCDRCGSFKIGKRVTAKALTWLVITALVATVLWYSMRDGALPGAWFACFLPLVFFLAPTGVLALGYRCKKCGNSHITYENVLGYPSYDRTVLDVPYEVTAKLYQDDY